MTPQGTYAVTTELILCSHPTENSRNAPNPNVKRSHRSALDLPARAIRWCRGVHRDPGVQPNGTRLRCFYRRRTRAGRAELGPRTA